MPARTAPRERELDLTNVGKVGRRTGVSLAPRALDAYGLEEISGMFSSPQKSPVKMLGLMGSIMEDEVVRTPRGAGRTTGICADIVISRKADGFTDTELTPDGVSVGPRSRRGSSHPPPRSVSPKKLGIRGSARRSGPPATHSQSAEVQETQSGEKPAGENIAIAEDLSTPTQAHTQKAASARPSRRFSPDQTPVRSSRPNRSKSERVSRISDSEPSLVERVSQLALPGLSHTPTSIDVPDIDITAPSLHDYDPVIEEEDANVGGRYGEEPEPPTPAHLLRSDIDDEDVDASFAPEKRAKSQKRSPTMANSRKKRKSDAIDDPADMSTTQRPAMKRAKRVSAEGTVARKATSSRKTTAPANSRPRGDKVLTEKSKNAKMSVRQRKEVDQVIEKVRARPGGTRSLFIMRRETPADDGVGRTRSGRLTYKPLAYWRNEECVYAENPNSPAMRPGDRLALTSIKEVVRSDEVALVPVHKRRNRAKTGKGHTKSRALSEDDSDIDYDNVEQYSDSDAEDWEKESGTFSGLVSIWDDERQAPIDEEEEVEIAHSANAIQTGEVNGADFRYAKLVSSKFFGAGVVDIPGGGMKRSKNARRMQMCFFVAQGRVSVDVGPLSGPASRFSIGKGGFWQVPRGKILLTLLRLSILSDYRKSIFDTERTQQARTGLFQPRMRSPNRAL